MVPNGYLLMFGPEHAEEQYRALENHKACEAGTKNIKGSDLTKVFPYINNEGIETATYTCLLYTSPSPRDQRGSRMPSSA